MRRSPRILFTAALTGALALVAAPALANGSGQTVDTPPWQWYIAAGGGEWGVSETSYNDIDTDTSLTNAWDGSLLNLFGPGYLDVTSAAATLQPAVPSDFVSVDCVTSTLTTSGDDQVVTCNETVTAPWGLSVTSDVRVFAPGDLARVTYLITNTTAAPVALGYEYSWNYGQSSGHVRSSVPNAEQSTADNDGFLQSPDVWSYNRSTINAGVAWGITGQPLLGTESSHNGYDQGAVRLLPSAGRTIAAGETIALAFFHKVQEPDVFMPGSVPIEGDPAGDGAAADPAEMPVPQPASSHTAATPASFMAEFASFSGRLTRGIPADVTVGNWQTAAADAPQIAATGVSQTTSLLLGGIAATLLAAGAVTLIARRRMGSRAGH